MNSKTNPLHTRNSVQWIVLFDAVGTVLFPQPHVVDAYLEHGIRFNSRLTREQVATRFAKARAELFGVGNRHSQAESQNGGLLSSDEIEREMWFQLVKQIYDDIRQVDELFEALWKHFATPENWQIYDDVVECFRQLKKQDAIIAIASNFDSRLLNIVKKKTELHLVDHIFCSSQIGFRKPDPRFYDSIQSAIRSACPIQRLQFAMVGDDLENDCDAPARLGWPSFHLNRKSLASPTNSIASLVELPYPLT